MSEDGEQNELGNELRQMSLRIAKASGAILETALEEYGEPDEDPEPDEPGTYITKPKPALKDMMASVTAWQAQAGKLLDAAPPEDDGKEKEPSVSLEKMREILEEFRKEVAGS